MNPTMFGVIGAGFLNQVPTLMSNYREWMSADEFWDLDKAITP